MLVNIPAVASTEGETASLTWVSHGTYTYVEDLRIPGRVVSGTFTDAEELTHNTIPLFAVVKGAGQTAPQNYLTIEGLEDSNAVSNKEWVGATSGAIFLPTGLPAMPPNVFIYIDSLFNAPKCLPQSNQAYNYIGFSSTVNQCAIKIEPEYHPKQTATMKILICVLPTFTVPLWAKSWTLRNRSGASLFWRRYSPNVEGNVIDTTAATFGEDFIVGQELEDGQIASFEPDGFTPGASYMLCAASAATDGAIIEFTP